MWRAKLQQHGFPGQTSEATDIEQETLRDSAKIKDNRLAAAALKHSDPGGDLDT